MEPDENDKIPGGKEILENSEIQTRKLEISERKKESKFPMLKPIKRKPMRPQTRKKTKQIYRSSARSSSGVYEFLKQKLPLRKPSIHIPRGCLSEVLHDIIPSSMTYTPKSICVEVLHSVKCLGVNLIDGKVLHGIPPTFPVDLICKCATRENINSSYHYIYDPMLANIQGEEYIISGYIDTDN